MLFIIKSKTRFYGQSINSSELLEALKNSRFDNAAPIQVRSGQFVGWLKVVYKNAYTNNLHFLIGGIDEDEYADIFSKGHILLDHFPDGKVVTKRELILLLEQLPDVTRILIEDSIDCYPLTLVYKCAEACPCIHLDCHYDDNAFIPN